MSWTPLPVGVENFEKLIENGCYYVDKTLLIKDLLNLRGEVNLFTRPPKIRENTEHEYAAVFF